MSAEASAEASAPNLNLGPEEKRVYGQLFRQADTESVGVVTGDIAVKFFEKTRLDSRILGEIWQIADHENRGFLTPAGFGIALRLIGHAQAGREPNMELALQQAPIPRFEGFTPTPPPAAQPLQAQGTGGVPIRIPPLTPEKVSQYASLFERQSLQPGNMLPGEAAKNIFEKSGLPNEILGRIWQLADTEQRGALVQTEFVIAMHLLTSFKTGQLRGLPNVLPAALYEAATRRGPAPRQIPSATGPQLSAIPRQLSGQAGLRPSSPLARSALQAQVTGLGQQQMQLQPQLQQQQPQPVASDWVITPADKARFDQFYADLDKTNKGFITGEEAVPFLSQSNLSEDALAQIWDLSDINSEGRLNKDTFAVAMYLIRQHRSKGGVLPTALPANLIPPSMRPQARPPTASASPFDLPEPPRPQPPPAPKSALDDLFGLDTPAPAPTQVAQVTGGSASRDPFANASPLPPSSPVRASPIVSQFKPFVPSSSFGRTLQPQATGGSANSAKPLSAMDDLLGDNDPESSNKLTNDTVELANLSNQIGTLSNQMQQVQGQRTTAQREISQTTQQKQNFEERLSQLKTLYEKEATDVTELRSQLKKLQDENRKLMTESATLDASYRDITTQHQQLVAALQADQQENQNLKQKISAVNAEIAQLKPQIEKLKLDARQQKGMVAINKKQLSTVEGERDKLKTEAEELTTSSEEFSRQINSASPVAAPAQVASPALSTASVNNPFFKRTGSTDMMGAFSASPAKPFATDKSFDDIFGGFTTGSASNTPPPPTSFKAQNTGTSTASPPLSRVGEGSTPFAAGIAAPLEPAATGASVQSAQDGAKSPSAAPEETQPALTREASIPGTFPEEPVKATEAAQPPASFAGNRDSEIFENMRKDDINAKDDFDSAFADFGSSTKVEDKAVDNTKAFTAFDSEFPPIAEIERDDTSDSGSDGNGFDDDFNPGSPPAAEEGKITPKPAASPFAPVPAPQSSDVAQPAAAFPDASSPFAPAAELAPAPTLTTNAAPAAPKGAFDDLDDDFEGLEDAKEGSADDEFANISRSNLDDFNSVFDSPSQPKSESTNVSNTFGIDSSFDFGTFSTTSTAVVQPAGNATPTATANGAKESESHDWDALFSELNDPSTEAKGDDAKSPTTGTESGRPTLEATGRALTEEGLHDDPILKNLTGMGYSRADAVNALEKYDYNLERAANYLASQS